MSFWDCWVKKVAPWHNGLKMFFRSAIITGPRRLPDGVEGVEGGGEADGHQVGGQQLGLLLF